jgi:FtsP/CotA-like multicopper oxidase with cupredoxin domain
LAGNKDQTHKNLFIWRFDMQNRKLSRQRHTSLAILMALSATPATLQLAHAGAGWGDSTDAVGSEIKTPTYYANSPSGIREESCYSAPPSSGAFDTLALTTPSTQSTCDTGTALRKFVDPLTAIPTAIPNKTTYPGSDYYEIAVVEYTQKMHSDLAKPTTLRGYVQLSTDGSGIPLANLDGSPVTLPDGNAAMAVAAPSYLGPMINATSGTPTRIKFYNLLPAGSAGNLHLPVDETLTGAGLGPDGISKYQQNRVEIHLHGGDNPWISDGTPHQWILPAADEIALSKPTNSDAVKSMARGVGAKNVPDMPDPGPGAMTYYFPNGQSGRMMWYHDHSLGVTRLNVYSGVAAGYMLKDQAGVGENTPALASLLPTDTIPLIIQDRTFVPKDIAVQDAKWKAVLGTEGDLWYPHVYETNQDPNSYDATNPVGRWDWGPWFWPVFPSTYNLPTGEVDTINGVTKLSEVSTTPEAFMDTPLVNGTAYPKMTVDPKAYRFRILNAANDRFLNLGLYVAADKKTIDAEDPTNPNRQPRLCDGKGLSTRQVPIADCTEIKMVHFDSSYPSEYGSAATEFPTEGGPTDSGWGSPNASLFPMGVPDPTTAGPNILQIGNEAGLLAKVHDIPSTIINYEYNKRSVTVLGIQEHGLYLGTAERADVVIDFSKYAGQTLILYNDSPAPVPASDPRIDYFTGNGDQTGAGGAPSTLPGYGPNTRTIMQIVVSKNPAQELDVTALKSALPQAYASVQAKPAVPEPEFSEAFPDMPSTRTNARIYTGSIYLGGLKGMSFTTPESINYFPVPACTSAVSCATAVNAQKNQPNNGLVTAPAGTPVNVYVQNKAVQELFDPAYGRMNATLGIELPFTSALTQTTIPLAYVDPVTETVADGETQFWKITHNGVDTHPVHFHLVNVQVINRVGWDGTVKVPYGDEFGWKETVKMNPLEDIVVAVRAKKPTLTGTTGRNGFGLPLSERLMDPSQPEGSALGFTQVDPLTGNPAVVANAVKVYGWEYAWHCHILGHEENDFMRPIKFDTNEAIPTAPTSLAITPAGELTWLDNASTEFKYTVQRALVTNGVIGAYGTDLTEDVSQVVGYAPLANATKFDDTTLAVQAFPVNAAPPIRLTNVTLTSATLSWPVNGDAPLGYSVSRSPAGENSFALLTTIPAIGPTASYTDSGLLPSTAYTYKVEPVSPSMAYSYRVSAVGAKGNGVAEVQTIPEVGTSGASTIDVTTANPVVIAPPTALAANATQARIRLTWTDVAVTPQIAPTSYAIERAANGGAFTQIATVNAAARAYNNTSITLGNTYTYRIVGKNALGTINSSAPSNVATVQYSTPEIPLTPAQGATTTTNVTLSWPQITNTTNYTLYRCIGNPDPLIPCATAIWTGTGTSRTQGGQTAGNTYTYTVKANNALGSSAQSAGVTLTMVSAAPAAPTATPDAVGSKIINLALPALPTGAASFNVLYQTRVNNAATWSTQATLATGVTSPVYQATNLATGQYRFRLVAVNASGTSANSALSNTVVAP